MKQTKNVCNLVLGHVDLKIFMYFFNSLKPSWNTSGLRRLKSLSSVYWHSAWLCQSILIIFIPITADTQNRRHIVTYCSSILTWDDGEMMNVSVCDGTLLRHGDPWICCCWDIPLHIIIHVTVCWRVYSRIWCLIIASRAHRILHSCHSNFEDRRRTSLLANYCVSWPWNHTQLEWTTPMKSINTPSSMPWWLE